MPTNNDRVESALRECMAAKIPFRRAAIVLAASSNETGNTFGIPRTPELPYPIECYSSRQVLCLEKGKSASNPLPYSWTSDAKWMKFLSNHGLLNGSGASAYLVSDAAKIDTLEAPNSILPWLFETIIDQRKLKMINAFSIGPTQMFLAYSPLAEPQYPMTSRFKNVEDLFDFYMSRSVAENFNGAWYDYLPTTRTDYPTPNSTAAMRESYLSNVQTGTVDWTDPTWAGYSNRFGAAVTTVWSIANRLNYPDIK